MLSSALVAALVMVATPAWAATVTLAPAEDTYLNLDATTYAASVELNVYTWPVNKIANAILLRWDLSSVPAGAVVESAVLELVMIRVDGADSTYDSTVHRLTRRPVLSLATGRTYDGVNEWTPSACCYQGIPLAQADLAPAESVTVLDRTLGVKRWAVTGIVRAWLADPALNLGLLVNSDLVAGDGGRSFASLEAVDVTQRPRLVVTYALSCLTPPTGTWSVTSLSAQVGTFTVEFQVTPAGAAVVDAVVGLARSAPTTYTDLAAIVLFDNRGFITARNGGGYSAVAAIPYQDGAMYQVRLAVDLTAHRYSAFVRSGGGAEQAVGVDYAFRLEQSTATSLAALGLRDSLGTTRVCGWALSLPPASPTFLTLTWQDNAGNEDGFRVDRGDDGGVLREVTRVGANVVTYRDETVARGHAYCYEVRAFNAAGASASSNRACKGPPGLPALTVSTEVTP